MDHARVILMGEPPPRLFHRESKLPRCPRHPKHPCTGSPIKLKRIAGTYTNRTGFFSITVTGKALKAAESYSFAVHHGRAVNLMVSADWVITKGVSKGTVAGAERWFVRLYLPSGLKATIAPDSVMPAQGAAADNPEVVNMNLATAAVPKNLKAVFKAVGVIPFTPDPGFPITWYCGAEAAVPNGHQIAPWDVSDPVVQADVGQTYSNMKNVTMNFMYGAGQSSSLGVAVSVPAASGAGLGWFQGANVGYQVSVTSNITIPFSQTSGYVNTNYQTGFVYQLYYTACPPYYTAAPSGFAGGSHSTHIFPLPGEYNKYCSWYEPNNQIPVSMGTSKAVTFSAGVNLLKFIGISLTAQTGYDNNAQASYLLPKGGWLCGTGSFPGNSSQGYVYAGKYTPSKAHPKEIRRNR